MLAQQVFNPTCQLPLQKGNQDREAEELLLANAGPECCLDRFGQQLVGLT